MPIDCYYFVDKAAAAGAAPALKNFCSILHCPAVFTQNLRPLLADLIQPECANQFGVGILNDAYNKNWPILGNFICGHHLSYFDALFAVNTHANFNLVFVYAKGCLANFRHDAGGSEQRPWCGCCQPPSELLRLLLPGSSYVWQQHRHHGHRRGSYRLSWNKQEMQKRCLRCNRPAYRRQHICKNFNPWSPSNRNSLNIWITMHSAAPSGS